MEQKHGLSNRRSFIRDAASLAALGAFGAGVLFKSCSSGKAKNVTEPVFNDQAPDGKVLKAGLIGCGGRGTGAAFNFLNAGPNLQITALGDVFQDRLDRCRQQLKERKDVEIADEKCFIGLDAYEKVIDSDVDIVLLTTPPYFRPSHFEAAVRARKHAFIEKPVAVDPVGARSIMASARMADAAGLKVIHGMQRHHQRDYVTTYNRIKNGAIGEIVSANCYWNSGQLWFVTPRPEWSDMENMLRDWVNWTWLSGDHIVEQHVHNIDVINWFTGKYPVRAVGSGSRQRRVTGDQYDNFSVDFVYDNDTHMHSMCRQVDGCANNISELITGTKGSSNCRNSITDLQGNELWKYSYPLNEEGESTPNAMKSAQDQEIVDFVTAIRTNTPLNTAEECAMSTLTAIMGRISAYTGKEVTLEEMMNSGLRLGPEEVTLGPSDIRAVIAVPGTDNQRKSRF